MRNIDKVRPYYRDYIDAKIRVKDISKEVGLVPSIVSQCLGKIIEEIQNEDMKIKIQCYDSSKLDINDSFNIEEIELKKDFTVGDWENMTFLERKEYY